MIVPPSGSNKLNVYLLFLLWAQGEIDGLPIMLGCTYSLLECPHNEHGFGFRDGDPFTEEIRQLDSIERARHLIAARLAIGETFGNADFHYRNTSTEKRILAAINNALSIVTGGAIGMSRAQSFIGSYDLEWGVVGYSDRGDPVVEFYLTNASTLRSANLDPTKVVRYGEEGQRAGNGDDALIGERWLQQRVRWRETFPSGQAPARPGEWFPFKQPFGPGSRLY